MLDMERLRDDVPYQASMRLRAQTDLLFLARLLGYTKIVDRIHQPVAELAIRKFPIGDDHDKIYQWDAVKERLQLDPRITFKSTLAVADNVQAIICTNGNVRIGKLTATKPLANAFAGEVTHHFVRPRDAAPTPFQALFPEFEIPPSAQRVGEYTAPCRTIEWKEPTVMAYSIETSISGWHFDIKDVDDVVDNVNSATPAGIEKVKRNFRINRKTLMPGGFLNLRGTRYNPFDLWGDTIDKARPGKIKMLVRGALRLKSGDRLQPGDFPQEHEVELLFPELLPYEFLRGEFDDDYSSFMTQYMNDAYGDNEVVFRKEDLLSITQPAHATPLTGKPAVAARFPYGGKQGMDHFAAAAGLQQGNRMWVTDAVRGKFSPSTAAYKLVQFAKRAGAHEVQVEETPGARYMQPAIQNYALVAGWPLTVQWLPFEDDDAVRALRIKSAEPLVASKRLLLSDAISSLKETYRQLAHFGMIADNELPCVISRLAELLPKSLAPAESAVEESDLSWDLARRRDMRDMVMGVGKYAPKVEAQPEPVYAPRPSNGLDDVLGGLNG